jgi:hypothetical protein
VALSTKSVWTKSMAGTSLQLIFVIDRCTAGFSANLATEINRVQTNIIIDCTVRGRGGT